VMDKDGPPDAVDSWRVETAQFIAQEYTIRLSISSSSSLLNVLN
jgi:hypothetical protein